MTPEKKSNHLKSKADLIGKLIKETRAVYRATGRELSQELITEQLSAVLDNIWSIYLAKQLAEKCDVEAEWMMQQLDQCDGDEEEGS